MGPGEVKGKVRVRVGGGPCQSSCPPADGPDGWPLLQVGSLRTARLGRAHDRDRTHGQAPLDRGTLVPPGASLGLMRVSDAPSSRSRPLPSPSREAFGRGRGVRRPHSGGPRVRESRAGRRVSTGVPEPPAQGCHVRADRLGRARLPSPRSCAVMRDGVSCGLPRQTRRGRRDRWPQPDHHKPGGKGQERNVRTDCSTRPPRPLGYAPFDPST